MIYIAYIILAIGALRLVIVLVNAISGIYIPQQVEVKTNAKVSVLIPARNEEINIAALLTDLQKVKYPNLEILVYNDESDDDTQLILESFKIKLPNLVIINGGKLPSGWLGKNHACHQLAEHAQGEFLLFLDADIRLQDGVLKRVLSHFIKHKLHLLSVFPKPQTVTKTEKSSVPLSNWVLVTILPLFLVRRTRAKVFAAANGQFMLFSASSYKCLWPHKVVRDRRIDDILIARMYKYLKLKVDTLLSDNSVTCRMYQTRQEATEGFLKYLAHFFGKRKIVTILFGIYSILAALVVFLFAGVSMGFIFLGLVLLTRIFASITGKQSIIMNLKYLPAQQWFLWYVIFKRIIAKQEQSKWKGRGISQMF